MSAGPIPAPAAAQFAITSETSMDSSSGLKFAKGRPFIGWSGAELCVEGLGALQDAYFLLVCFDIRGDRRVRGRDAIVCGNEG